MEELESLVRTHVLQTSGQSTFNRKPGRKGLMRPEKRPANPLDHELRLATRPLSTSSCPSASTASLATGKTVQNSFPALYRPRAPNCSQQLALKTHPGRKN